jgi:hypothetical protein
MPLASSPSGDAASLEARTVRRPVSPSAGSRSIVQSRVPAAWLSAALSLDSLWPPAGTRQ